MISKLDDLKWLDLSSVVGASYNELDDIVLHLQSALKLSYRLIRDVSLGSAYFDKYVSNHVIKQSFTSKKWHLYRHMNQLSTTLQGRWRPEAFTTFQKYYRFYAPGLNSRTIFYLSYRVLFRTHKCLERRPYELSQNLYVLCLWCLVLLPYLP